MLLPTISAGRHTYRRVTAAALLVTAVGSWAVIGPAVADTKPGHARPSSGNLEPSAPDRNASCVGAWRLSIAERPETLPALVTFSADRTLVFGETSVVLAANSDGELTRTSDIRGAIHVTKDTFTGPLTIAVSHPTGPGTTINTTATALRITA